jgi:hypothetical protein
MANASAERGNIIIAKPPAKIVWAFFYLRGYEEKLSGRE